PSPYRGLLSVHSGGMPADARSVEAAGADLVRSGQPRASRDDADQARRLGAMAGDVPGLTTSKGEHDEHDETMPRHDLDPGHRLRAGGPRARPTRNPPHRSGARAGEGQ